MKRNFLIGLVLASLVATSAQAADLKVSLAGIHSADGAIMIGLYDTAEGFIAAVNDSTKTAVINRKDRLVGVSMRAKSGSQSIIFTDLPPSRYAVIVLHDENDNGLLDANSVGLPTEGYGFSNNATGLFSAPSFDAAAVTVGQADMGITISMVYPVMHSSQQWLEFEKLIGK